MTDYAQIFCTVDDLVNDIEAPGGDVARMYQAIRDACDYLQKEIGWFVPVTETVKFDGAGTKKLFISPLLAVTSIVNDDDTLVADTDYILQPYKRHWANGPYSWLEVGPDATLLSEWLDELNGVQIAGRWGKYERSAALTATASAQTTTTETTLTVSDGSQVSPGMVLLHQSEQELVTGYGSPTAAVTTVNGTVDASVEEITLTAVTGINVGEIIRIDFEQMKVRDRNTTTKKVAVWRGWNRTNRVSHLSAANVDVYRTFNVQRGVNGTTAATHTAGLTLSRYYAPDDVRFLTREIATLMLNKAKSQYAGRSGNEQTGVTMYYDAFPRFDIDRIRAKYDIPRAR